MRMLSQDCVRETPLVCLRAGAPFSISFSSVSTAGYTS